MFGGVLAKDDAPCRRVDKTVFMMVIGGIVGAQVVKKFFGIGAAIWKWSFNRITSNVWRVLAKDDALCRRGMNRIGVLAFCRRDGIVRRNWGNE